MSSKETLKILLQPFVTTRDLAKLLGKAICTASKKMAEIHRRAQQEGFITQKGVAPSKRVIDFLKIDMEELIANAKIENEIEIGDKK